MKQTSPPLLHPGETVLLTVACDNRVNHSTLPVGNEDGQLAFFGSDNAGIPSVEAAKRAAAPQNRPNFDFFNYAGIHRPVWLYTTPKEYIEDVTVVPAVDGTVQYAVKTTGSAPVHVTVLDADGNAVASAEGAEGTITIPEVHLWSPDPARPTCTPCTSPAGRMSTIRPLACAALRCGAHRCF